MGMSKFLEINDLCVEYQSRHETVYAVNHVSLSLNRGETLGLVGETGAGKTTLALATMRLLPKVTGRISRGEILLDGKNLLALSEEEMRKIRGAQISMIFQDPMTSLNPVLTVKEQIEEALSFHFALSAEDKEKKVEDILRVVGIDSARKNEYPHQFSGGMKQRVVIAMSLICQPLLLLADEPTTALDVTIQAQILSRISKHLLC